MTPLLYQIPAHFGALMQSGQAELFGAIIKDSATGHILGHVQQTGALGQFMQTAVGIASDGSSMLSPLGVVSIVQNQQIKNSLAAVQNGMIYMQGLQYGALALSGLGLGVSVAGFAVMNARLGSISRQLQSLGDDVRKVTEDRRSDDLRTLLAEIGADLHNVDTLTSRKDPARVAEHLQLALSRNARKLEEHFTMGLNGADAPSIERIDQLWSIASAIRLCQEAAVQALFAADEVEISRLFAENELERLMLLYEQLEPDRLARSVAQSETEFESATMLRRDALQQAQVLTDGVKGGILALGSQASLALELKQQGLSSLDFIRTARDEEKAPLAFLAAAA